MPVKKSVTPKGPSERVKIQIGVVKRMQKEVAAYEKEIIVNEAKLKKMKVGCLIIPPFLEISNSFTLSTNPFPTLYNSTFTPGRGEGRVRHQEI